MSDRLEKRKNAFKSKSESTHARNRRETESLRKEHRVASVLAKRMKMSPVESMSADTVGPGNDAACFNEEEVKMAISLIQVRVNLFS